MKTSEDPEASDEDDKVTSMHATLKKAEKLASSILEKRGLTGHMIVSK